MNDVGKMKMETNIFIYYLYFFSSFFFFRSQRKRRSVSLVVNIALLELTLSFLWRHDCTSGKALTHLGDVGGKLLGLRQVNMVVRLLRNDEFNQIYKIGL